ncbi:hypothetical protein MMC21_005146 [Puttea exsequens]|nr:hypothetical protein [Puttea exsequens]
MPLNLLIGDSVWEKLLRGAEKETVQTALEGVDVETDWTGLLSDMADDRVEILAEVFELEAPQILLFDDVVSATLIEASPRLELIAVWTAVSDKAIAGSSEEAVEQVEDEAVEHFKDETVELIEGEVGKWIEDEIVWLPLPGFPVVDPLKIVLRMLSES